MARSRKTGIRRAIEQLLVPELVARGFVPEPDASGGNLDPFGRFVRRSERGVDVLVIHFNKNRPSHFHFHVARASLVEGASKRFPAGIEPNFVVWRRGLIYRRWFGVKKFAREGISAEEYAAAVRASMRRLDVVERVLESGKRSLYVEEFPQGWREALGYWAFCLLTVLLPVCAAVWLGGWFWRHL
jgi:hypothetical protein